MPVDQFTLYGGYTVAHVSIIYTSINFSNMLWLAIYAVALQSRTPVSFIFLWDIQKKKQYRSRIFNKEIRPCNNTLSNAMFAICWRPNTPAGESVGMWFSHSLSLHMVASNSLKMVSNELDRCLNIMFLLLTEQSEKFGLLYQQYVITEYRSLKMGRNKMSIKWSPSVCK